MSLIDQLSFDRFFMGRGASRKKTIFDRLSLSFLLLFLCGFSLPAQAEQAIEISPLQHQAFEDGAPRQKQGVGIKQYGRGQVPGRRSGGGRRDDCPTVPLPLTAIVPQTEDTTQNPPIPIVGGVTAAERPTFWFYVPYALNAELTAEFILQDETGAEIYQLSSTDFPSSEQVPGIISIALPTTVPPLEIGKVYEWYFKVNCGEEVPIYTSGGIERIALDNALSQQLANALPQEQALLYQENEIWYDAITTLGNLSRSNPSDRAIADEWNRLLQTLGIAEILTETSANP